LMNFDPVKLVLLASVFGVWGGQTGILRVFRAVYTRPETAKTGGLPACDPCCPTVSYAFRRE
jgi:hypothetical protein